MTKKDNLILKLNEAVERMETSKEDNIKVYECVFQDIIEECYPEKCWWQVSDVNIFMDLLSHKSPRKTAEKIIKSIKD